MVALEMEFPLVTLYVWLLLLGKVKIHLDDFFSVLLVDTLFKPESHINPDHKPKYIYILGHSASVYERWENGERVSTNKDELKGAVQAIDRVHSVCSREIGGTLQLSVEVGMLYHCIR